MVRRDFMGERVQRIRTRWLLGGVEGEVMNSSMRRDAIACPRPLRYVSTNHSMIISTVHIAVRYL